MGSGFGKQIPFLCGNTRVGKQERLYRTQIGFSSSSVSPNRGFYTWCHLDLKQLKVHSEMGGGLTQTNHQQHSDCYASNCVPSKLGR